MRLDSARAFNQELLTVSGLDAPEAFASALNIPVDRMMEAWRNTAEARPGPGLGLGIAPGKRAGDYHVAVRAQNEELGERIRERASGEADVRIIPEIEARNWYRERQRPVQAGLQIAPFGVGYVGTHGPVARDRETGRFGVVSNTHVLSDTGRLPVGTPIGQPFGGSLDDFIGILHRHVPISFSSTNLVDAAFALYAARGEQRVRVLPLWLAAISANIRAVVSAGPGDLGRPVGKSGRTTEDTHGQITAVEVNIPVNMGLGIARFARQIEVSTLGPKVFSAAGDSGSCSGFLDAHEAFGLLGAGGMDNTGVDFTYHSDLPTVERLLDVEIVKGAA